MQRESIRDIPARLYTGSIERVDITALLPNMRKLHWRFEREIGNPDNGIGVWRMQVGPGKDGDDRTELQLVDAFPDEGTPLRKVAKRWLRGHEPYSTAADIRIA